MKFGRLVGWGIVIYAIVSLAWSGIVLHGFAGSILARLLMLAVLIAVVTVATRSLGFYSERDVIPYAFGWMVTTALLDAVFVVPAAGWGIYGDWNVWVGYVLVFCIPLIATLVTRKRATLA